MVDEIPPSTTREAPVTKLEASDARNKRAASSSPSSPTRFIGVISKMRAQDGSSAKNGAVISEGNQPGHRTFTRTPRRAHDAARFLVRLITAAFDVWYATGKCGWAARPAADEMLTIEPPR